MKNRFLIAVMSVLLVLALGACREEASEAPPETSTSEIPGIGAEDDVSPLNAQTWIDDVTIGHELNTDGSVLIGEGGDDFAPGETVYVAMEVGDAPEGAAVMVMWYGPGEMTIGDGEEKSVAPDQKYLNFSANTTGWQVGDYRAEVWVGDEKVNEQHFQIVEAGLAGR